MFIDVFTAFLMVYTVTVFAVIVLFNEEIRAIKERDPAAKSAIEIVILYPGLHAIVFHRIAYPLYQFKIPFLPRFISQMGRFLTGIEIHPGAKIGKNFFIDHGMGVVIGETAIIGDNVTLFQGVTLGGTGKECGKRHPTLENNVVVGTGAKVLGNITIGENSYVGANAVVVKNVPPNATVVGVPGHITKQEGKRIDTNLDHAKILDPIMSDMTRLLRRIRSLEEKAGIVKKDIEEGDQIER